MPLDFEQTVDAFADEHRLAGLAVGVVRDGQLTRVATRGDAAIESRRPVSSRSVFRIGSISKLFTGIAVMQLVAEGRVTLDDPVNEHLRRYRVEGPPDAPQPRVRHLLTHTSGIGELRHFTDLARPFMGMGAKPGTPIPDLGDYYGPALKATVAPGTRWAYANHAFATLGALVEDVTGTPFAEHMRTQVLEPLGMHRSDFLLNDRVESELCVGYALRRGRIKPARYVDIIPAPAGSLFSSVDDMRHFVTALCRGGEPVLDAKLLDEMMRPQFSVDPRLPGMGLAFFLDDIEGHRVVSHDGGVDGFVSTMHVAPEDGVGVLAFTNTNSTRISIDIGGFADRLLRGELGVPLEPRADVPETPAVWPDVVGTYGLRPGLNTNAHAWMFVGGEVEVVVAGDHLALRALFGPASKPLRLRPAVSDDPRVFSFGIGATRVGVAFGDDEIHLGAPLNLVMYRRPYSLRGRLRGGAIAAGALAVATAARRGRRRRPS